jgi:hypothetical protein
MTKTTKIAENDKTEKTTKKAENGLNFKTVKTAKKLKNRQNRAKLGFLKIGQKVVKKGQNFPVIPKTKTPAKHARKVDRP